jgi:hypothetical protein
MLKRLSVRIALAVVTILIICVLLFMSGILPIPTVDVVEKIKAETPDPDESFLKDDVIADKNPPFIADLVSKNEPYLNKSAAVIGLDIIGAKDEDREWMDTLYPSYASAIKAVRDHGKTVLPSVNLINGKAKQFDDGLYAVMDLAYFHGIDGKVPSFSDLMHRFYEATKTNPKAAAFFSAGLSLDGISVDPVDADARKQFLAAFESDETASKPAGFYTWTDELKTLFRFFRFFQQDIRDNREIADAAAAALLKDEALRKDYANVLAFYSGLTNPFADLSCADLIDGDKVSEKSLGEIAAAKGLPSHPYGVGVCILPYSKSTETVLFEKLFPEGIPQNVNLMKEMILRIRSGEVNLAPTEKSGWYDRQVYALETLLLTEKGPESQKLFLTAKYKKRLLEAFKAIITKTRETHIRQVTNTLSTAEPKRFAPTLRVEPAPSFYLRTARSYAFVEQVVTTSLGKETLHALNRLRQNAKCDMPLDQEISYMKNLFYGFYLITCDDIGMKPDLAEAELANPDDAMKTATDWLEVFEDDTDLGLDTRVSVPIFIDPSANKTLLWATLGTRLANLEATYKKPPSIQMVDSEGKTVRDQMPEDNLGPSNYLIPVDEFSEITLPRLGVLTREELRAVCDKEKTKEKIIEALQK